MLEHYIACLEGLDVARATVACAERAHAAQSHPRLLSDALYPSVGLHAAGFTVESLIPAFVRAQSSDVIAPAAVILTSASGDERYLAFPDIVHATQLAHLASAQFYGIHASLAARPF